MERLLFTAEEIRGQNHEAPFGIGVVDLSEDLGQIGLVGRFGLLQRAVDGLQMVSAGAPRKLRADLLIEQCEPDGILLPESQGGEASGEGCGIVEFVQWATTVVHAFGTIDQQCAPQIGVFFVLLDIESVLTAPNLPVDVPKIVSWHVLTVLNELDGLPKVWTAMHPREKALNDVAGPEFHRRYASDCFRMQIVFGIGHHAAIRLELSVCS